MRRQRGDDEARQRHKVRLAMSPFLSQLFPARETIGRLTIDLMASAAPAAETQVNLVRTQHLVAGVRRGFEETVNDLPSELRVNSHVTDVRKAIEQVERQVSDLAELADQKR